MADEIIADNHSYQVEEVKRVMLKPLILIWTDKMSDEARLILGI